MEWQTSPRRHRLLDGNLAETWGGGHRNFCNASGVWVLIELSSGGNSAWNSFARKRGARSLYLVRELSCLKGVSPRGGSKSSVSEKGKLKVSSGRGEAVLKFPKKNYMKERGG